MLRTLVFIISKHFEHTYLQYDKDYSITGFIFYAHLLYFLGFLYVYFYNNSFSLEKHTYVYYFYEKIKLFKLHNIISYIHIYIYIVYVTSYVTCVDAFDHRTT